MSGNCAHENGICGLSGEKCQGHIGCCGYERSLNDKSMRTLADKLIRPAVDIVSVPDANGNPVHAVCIIGDKTIEPWSGREVILGAGLLALLRTQDQRHSCEGCEMDGNCHAGCSHGTGGEEIQR